MGKKTILFADDDPEIHRLVSVLLKQENIDVLSAVNGMVALELWRKHPVDVVILDINMPFLDGLEVCRRIRTRSDVPIMMLTALGKEQDIVDGLEAGADDYLVKPFRKKEFVARVAAILRRSARIENSINGQLLYDKLMLDINSHRLIYKGKTIQISPLEFELLRYLMQNIGVVISKEELLENVWGYIHIEGDLNIVEATIRRLRKKLEIDPSNPRYIKTVWGAGYCFGR